MSTNKNTSPTRWQNPNEARRRTPVDPAARPIPAKGETVDTSKPAIAKPAVRSQRDYIGPALAAIGLKPEGTKAIAAVSAQNQGLLAAIILAQAFDRLGEKLISAAAVSTYVRSP